MTRDEQECVGMTIDIWDDWECNGMTRGDWDD